MTSHASSLKSHMTKYSEVLPYSCIVRLAWCESDNKSHDTYDAIGVCKGVCIIKRMPSLRPSLMFMIIFCGSVNMQVLENPPLHLYSTAEDVLQFVGEASGKLFAVGSGYSKLNVNIS